MMPGPEIPTSATLEARRFAIGLRLFYAAAFGLMGVQLPFFPVWLQGVDVGPAWIGLIVAVPALTRFTVLPLVTARAQRRRSLRPALIVTALLTAIGFSTLGLFHAPAAILIAFVLTACAWTPMLPLTDAYALQGVARHGLHYGPLRLWGSGAFVLGTLGGGLLADRLDAAHLIWPMAALAVFGAMAGLALRPLEVGDLAVATRRGGPPLLRQPAFLAVILAAALIQGSHAAYYGFASIAWRASGLDGATVAGLWTLGVLAEIVAFMASPRIAIAPAGLIAIGGSCAVLRWMVTAQAPSLPVLAAVQALHGATYGVTLLGTMGLLARIAPTRMMASAQGYLAAASGIVMSCASVLVGMMYARLGAEVYHAMAVMAAAGVGVMWLARRGLPPSNGAQPHSDASGGSTMLPS
ncbi:MAG: MFS transporter [Xanthobacteraceae bacterium]|nr:MFS transporter [Xanthobacteraceae bacterium]